MNFFLHVRCKVDRLGYGFYLKAVRVAHSLTKHISEAIAELRLRLTSTKEGARKMRGDGSDSTSQKS